MENSIETGYAVVKVEVQVILLGPSEIYLGLLLFLFSKRGEYLSVYLKATSSCRIAV